MRRKKEKQTIDWQLLVISGLLIAWGLLTMATASFPLSLKNFGQPWHYLFSQLIKLVLGLLLAFLAFRLPLVKIKKYAPYFFAFTLILLGLVFIPQISVKSGGASRWLNFWGFSFQPSEFLKITFILYLAAWLSSRKTKGRKKQLGWQALIPFIIVLTILLAFLIKQPDLSTLLIVAAIGLFLYFLTPSPWWHSVCLCLLLLAAFSIFVFSSPYRVTRLKAMIEPQSDALGSRYQLQQALIAIGSGKLLGIEGGLALGLSRQKFGFLPESITDSIFAIVAEETGFLGAFLLILLFLLFLVKGVKIGLKAKNDFSRLAAMGIAFWIGLQALLNIGGIIGIIPLAGIPLPFFSYGGSHLIAELIAVGILLNISKAL